MTTVLHVIAVWFHALPAVALVLITLSAGATGGLALGAVRLRGAGLGVGGVLFAGLAVGHLAAAGNIPLDHAMLDLVRELGLVLFVYSIGIQVGPGFLDSLRRSGLALNTMAAAVVVLGAVTAAVLAPVLNIPLPAALGILSGAVTNTPSLGAVQQALKEAGLGSDALALPSLGYAVAYPFGIAGILLTMTAIRAAFHIDPVAEAHAVEQRRRAEQPVIETLDVVVRRPLPDGFSVRDIATASNGAIRVSRLMRGGALDVPAEDTLVLAGDVLHLVGPREVLDAARDRLGEAYNAALTTKGTDLRWERMVVTSNAVVGRSIAASGLEIRLDVRISRITRSGIEIVPSQNLPLQFGDIVTIIGRPGALSAAAQFLGNSQQRLQLVHMGPMFVGILAGLLLGSIPLALPGMPAPVKLGLAGGPLVAAIILSRIGRIGRLVWFMPPAANAALRETGIILFLAAVGILSGGRFVATLASGDGLAWMACGAAITLVPLIVVGLFARLVRGLDYPSLCGLLAGSMTDPPALAFANALSPSQAPALAYATVYPVTMCLRILSPQILALLLL